MKGGGIFPAQFIQCYQKHKKEHSGFHSKKCNYHCICLLVSELSTGKQKFIVTSLLIYKSATILKLSCVV